MKEAQKQEQYALAEKLLSEQNFVAATVVGAVAAILAAVGYGITATLWGYAYGFAAAGIGIVVGASMQFLGRGIDARFGVLASVYTIAGCLLGNVFRFDPTLARTLLTAPQEVLLRERIWTSAARSLADISFIDFVYWFVAVFAAVFLAKRPLSRAQRLAIGLYSLRERPGN